MTRCSGQHFQIPLTQGKFVTVDECDFEYLNKWKWYCAIRGDVFYAARMDKVDNKRIQIYMHRELLKSKFIDHIDKNGLNNCRNNLRACLYKENMRNKTKQTKKNGSFSSKFKGVAFDMKNKKWMCALTIDGKQIWLGRFTSEIEAAKEYNKAALKYHGSFASLNEVK